MGNFMVKVTKIKKSGVEKTSFWAGFISETIRFLWKWRKGVEIADFQFWTRFQGCFFIESVL